MAQIPPRKRIESPHIEIRHLDAMSARFSKISLRVCTNQRREKTEGPPRVHIQTTQAFVPPGADTWRRGAPQPPPLVVLPLKPLDYFEFLQRFVLEMTSMPFVYLVVFKALSFQLFSIFLKEFGERFE